MSTRYRRKKNRTFDHEITLIGEKITYDDLMNPVVERLETRVLCDVESIGSNEFYDASAQGLKPSITFVVHDFEYNNEHIIVFGNNDYKVIRTYADDGETEITCERVIGSG